MSTQKQIKELLGELETETDAMKKRKLRIKLRKLGHTGGLGKPTVKKAAAKKTTKKKAAAKKTTKKKVKAETTESSEE